MQRGVEFKVLDDPSIDTSSRTGKLVMGILALIAEFENDIRRERQQDGINKAKAAGVRFGPKPLLTLSVIEKIKALRADGATVPEIMRRSKLSKASVYRALGGETTAGRKGYLSPVTAPGWAKGADGGGMERGHVPS